MEMSSNNGEQFSRVVLISSLALMIGVGQIAPAWAAIDNTVTVTGSSPGNTDDVTNTDSESADVVDSAPALQLPRSLTIPQTLRLVKPLPTPTRSQIQVTSR